MEDTAEVNKKVYSILTSLVRNPSWCPTKGSIELSKQIISKLIHTAKNNKLAVLLHHFTECRACEPSISEEHQKEIKKLYSASLAASLAVDLAEKKVVTAFRRSKIDFCLIKNWSLYPKLYNDFPRTRTDVDFLIIIKDRKKIIELLSGLGFRKYDHFQMSSKDTERVFYEEYVVRNKKNKVKIDIRYQVAMPNSEDYPLFLQKDVVYLSSEVLKYPNTRKNPLPIELFLLVQIMHFFSNDLMRGLRYLYEIIYLAKLYQDRINWRRFDRLARQYNARLVAMFVFSFAKSVFGFGLEYPKKPTISEFLSIKLARSVLPPTQIVFFPLDLWREEFIWRENLLLRLFLQPKSFLQKIYELKERNARSVFLEKVTTSM